jgi:hypothetical protein
MQYPEYAPPKKGLSTKAKIGIVVGIVVAVVVVIVLILLLSGVLSQVQITDFDVVRPDPYDDLIQVSYTLKNNANQDATVEIEYTFDGDSRRVATYEVTARQSRRITEDFYEMEGGLWVAQIKSVQLH